MPATHHPLETLVVAQLMRLRQDNSRFQQMYSDPSAAASDPKLRVLAAQLTDRVNRLDCMLDHMASCGFVAVAS